MQQRGFTLIELLIVVAIIGIISAIALAYVTTAIDRAKQKRTMSDIRNIGTAIAAYEVDFNQYPADLATMAELATALVPTYLKAVPPKDGWRSPLLFASDEAGDSYTLRSLGKLNQEDAVYNRGAVHRFTDDIVMVDGQFAQWPDGLQQ